MNVSKALLMGLASLGLATFAQAGTETFTVIGSNIQTNGFATLLIPQFNTMGGTLALQTIDFNLSGAAAIKFTISNSDSASDSAYYGVVASVEFDLENPLGGNLAVVIPATDYPNGYTGSTCAPTSHGTVPDPTCGTLAPGSTTGQVTVNATNAVDTNSLLCTSFPALCSDFTGTGTTTDYVDAFNKTVVNTSGGIVTSTTQANGTPTVQVTYTYGPATTTPEPVSMVLFGTGLTALALIGRKRFSRR